MEEAVRIIGIIIAVVIWGVSLVRKASQQGDAPSQPLPDDWEDWPEPHDDDDDDDIVWPEEIAPQPTMGRPVPAAGADPYAAQRADMLAQVDGLSRGVDELARSARVSRATTSIAEALAGYTTPRLSALRAAVTSNPDPTSSRIRRDYDHLDMIFGACETFVNQRLDAAQRQALGDIDELARACYLPMLEFASANRISLQSAHPIAVLTPFDLATWTGFIPTGLAPLFLPPDFFSNIRWWPAIAHEIAHDFLAGTDADDALRRELGIPSEDDGSRLLRVTGRGLSVYDIFRVFGVWFEELFCDVTGALMLGPAYGYTMVELFADPGNPRRTATAGTDYTGMRYRVHPPRLLRVLTCAHALELVGEDEAAVEIRQVWRARHGDQPAITLPVMGGAVELATADLARLAGGVVKALHGTALQALDGHSLIDIPGLDYGPHRAAEARRARDEMLSGRPPTGHRPLAVVAGAVLAWWKARDREDTLLALARRALVGVTETRDDAYSQQRRRTRGQGHGQGQGQGEGEGDRRAPASPRARAREAFLLHVMLSPPPAVARTRPGAAGFAARRQWPPARMSATRTAGAGPRGGPGQAS